MGEAWPEDAPDSLLVQGVRARSDSAFRLLYDRYTPRAFQIAWRILGGIEQDAEEAVQEGWIRAVESLGRWASKGSFGAWLNGIVAHVALDMIRRNKRVFESDEEEVAGAPEALDERIDLEVAIRLLAPGYRAVLVLHDIEGFSHEEIAEPFGISARASKAQLF